MSDLEVVGLRLVEGVNLGHHGVAEGVSPVAATRNKLLLELGMSTLWQLKNLAHFPPFNIEPVFGLLNDLAYPSHQMIKSTVQIQMQLMLHLSYHGAHPDPKLYRITVVWQAES